MRGILGQRLRAHVGGEELRMALFQTEIRGALVAEEHVAVADEELVDADHGGFGRRGVAHNVGIGNRGAKAVRLEKGRDPLEAPLQRAHHAIFVARGQPRLPRVHPARVPVSQHECDSILPAPEMRGCRDRGTGESAAAENKTAAKKAPADVNYALVTAFGRRRFDICEPMSQPRLSSVSSAMIPCEMTQ